MQVCIAQNGDSKRRLQRGRARYFQVPRDLRPIAEKSERIFGEQRGACCRDIAGADGGNGAPPELLNDYRTLVSQRLHGARKIVHWIRSQVAHVHGGLGAHWSTAIVGITGEGFIVSVSY